MQQIPSFLPSETAAQNDSGLTTSQIYDLYRYITDVCHSSSGTISPPELPANAVKLVADFGDIDSITFWFVDSWPVAASDEMTLTHWVI